MDAFSDLAFFTLLIKHGSLAADIEEGLLLAGKAGIREILRRGA